FAILMSHITCDEKLRSNLQLKSPVILLLKPKYKPAHSVSTFIAHYYTIHWAGLNVTMHSSLILAWVILG
ncbi:MAG: hypothetical protein MJE68_00660, partial [Proteobacteria bacterium]|nr:hypothetical protein [Pseudomonadota bacterium]